MTQQGQLIGGRYRLIRPLGSGGMGQVWKALDETLDSDVAIKELWLPPATAAAERAERLQRAAREARNAAKLRDHPNVVTVHDVVVENEAPWIVMQLVSGGTLQERLAKKGPLSVDAAAKVSEALLKALDAAHRAGIVHRDVKPANVMVDASGGILLTDFGIAANQADQGLTGTGVVIGSAPYLSPERARGEKGKAAGDLFSLGTTLYEAVEGVSPFHRETATGSLHAVAYDEAPPPKRAGRLTPLITRLLEKDQDRRPKISEALALLDPSLPATKRETVATPRAPQKPKSAQKPKSPAKSTAPQKPKSAAKSAAPRPKSPATVAKPSTSGTSAAGSSGGGSGAFMGWLFVAAVVLAILYGENEAFADWVSEGLHGDVSSAQVGDCVHWVPPEGNEQRGWVQVPCWSAATGFTVLERRAGSNCGIPAIVRNTTAKQEIPVYGPGNRTDYLCVMPKPENDSDDDS
ncbi:hypothetical protein FCH28_01930 [Streptomyces piniterrae]|uniref:non-specific serine/threonine protein kinase n=1 Tax=Streptomyces piniterrae TaxID=2571125 RepID=A0A4V5MLY2_9ACTN|nr:serine/threonine-protein kinase [Streptomyces piniterrae]TJZ58938.1 hypothetical protein FCH28_01930 [Streptomyces piniterrae]